MIPSDFSAPALARSNRHLRLDTLVRLRWLAIAGQSLAVAGVHFGLGFTLPFGWCFSVIAVSAWLNIALRVRFPLSHRLQDGAATALLAFDIIQLAALLYLTGGLAEPVHDPVPRAGDDLGDGAAAAAHAGARRFWRSRWRRCSASSTCRCPGPAPTSPCCRPTTSSATGSRSCWAWASPASTPGASPRRRATSRTRSPRPNWCWPASSTSRSSTGSPPPPPTNSAPLSARSPWSPAN